MRQIGTFRVKISKSTDKKKLTNGTIKKYEYGSISLRSPDLTKFIGKDVMVRVFVDGSERPFSK